MRYDPDGVELAGFGRDLIRVADHNLYYAKEHGRAQIIGGDA